MFCLSRHFFRTIAVFEIKTCKVAHNFGSSAKVRYNSADLQRRLVIKFPFGTFGRSNGGVASEYLWMVLTYFCDIDTQLKKNFQTTIPWRLGDY